MMNGQMMTPFGWAFMLIFWILVVLVIAFAVRRWTPRNSGGGPREKSPLDRLKERYARGEISREEFERKKRDL